MRKSNWPASSRHDRGYGHNWDKLRKRILLRDCGICQVCGRAAQAVDHITSKAKASRLRWTPEQIDAESNLQSICIPCHEAKTEAEQGKTKREKVTTGVDGWPVSC